MDLVFIENSRAIIVDFKTDNVGAEEAEVRSEAYRPQMNTYCRALEKISGLPVKEALIYFLRPGKVISIRGVAMQ